ncbi:MAG TPA: DUF6484 domain-containing protein [Steroidobacteraceae bacterium]|nr:DUF6484 domain-containing protein [Steroidobacteraceae bacterium]
MSADLREAASSAVSAEESPEADRGELGSLLRAPSSRARAAGAVAVLGRIAGVDAAGVVSVEIPGTTGALPARLATPLSRDDLLDAREAGGSAVLVFENGDPALPIIVGLVQTTVPARVPTPPAAPQVIEADVDGKRVRITAADEIVLECGSASITLRRNGRVVVRGTYIESYSDGTNRIKGGQVRIN